MLDARRGKDGELKHDGSSPPKVEFEPAKSLALGSRQAVFSGCFAVVY